MSDNITILDDRSQRKQGATAGSASLANLQWQHPDGTPFTEQEAVFSLRQKIRELEEFITWAYNTHGIDIDEHIDVISEDRYYSGPHNKTTRAFTKLDIEIVKRYPDYNRSG